MIRCLGTAVMTLLWSLWVVAFLAAAVLVLSKGDTKSRKRLAAASFPSARWRRERGSTEAGDAISSVLGRPRRHVPRPATEPRGALQEGRVGEGPRCNVRSS